jgi:hypothetical protein
MVTDAFCFYSHNFVARMISFSFRNESPKISQHLLGFLQSLQFASSEI